MMIEKNLNEAIETLQGKITNQIADATDEVKVDRHKHIEALRNEFHEELSVPGLIGPDKAKFKFLKLKDYISHSNEEMIEGFSSQKKLMKIALEEFSKDVSSRSSALEENIQKLLEESLSNHKKELDRLADKSLEMSAWQLNFQERI